MRNQAKRGGGPRQFKSKIDKTRPEKATLIIERLTDDGRGLAFDKKRPLFIENALPGETVEAEFSKQGKVWVGKVEEIKQVSEQRVEPNCEFYGRCGGCQLQHMRYEGQLSAKQANFDFKMQRAFPNAEMAAPMQSEPFGYRHRAKFAFVGSLIGFRERRSTKIIALDSCPLLEEKLNAALPAIFERLKPALKKIGKGEFDVVIDSNGEIGASLSAVTTGNGRDNETESKTAISVEHVQLFDDAASLPTDLSLHTQGMNIAFEAGDFTQVNAGINTQISARVLELLAPEQGDVIADFFCGLGNFSLPIAKAAGRVVGFEVDDAMVTRAALNAKKNGIENSEFRRMDLFESIATMNFESLNKAVLDPPRAGARRLCEALCASSVQTIVYVSCNPETLIRDLQILCDDNCERPFSVVNIGMADMFPQTQHVEAIALLQRD